jgi:hypothetical protein
LKPIHESDRCVLRPFQFIQEFFEALDLDRQRRILARCQRRRANVIPIDIAETRQRPFRIHLRG